MLSVTPAGASTSTFQFSVYNPISSTNGNSGYQNNFGNSLTFGGGTNGASGGVANATVFAWDTGTFNSTNGTTFQPGQIGDATGTGTYNNNNPNMPLGLTDCNQYEGANCGSPMHQVSNEYGYDFVLIEFGAAVNLNSITLSTYQGVSGDSQDFTYVAGTGANPTINSNGTTSVSSLLAGATTVNCNTYFGSTNYNCTTGASNTYGSSQNFSGNDVTWLLIGAADPVGSSTDYFKISDLQISTYNAPSVPEPSTFGLIGLALVGLGIYGRKRKSA